MNTVPESNSTSEEDDEPRFRHDFIVTLSGYGRDEEEAFEDAMKGTQDAPPYHDHCTIDRSDVADEEQTSDSSEVESIDPVSLTPINTGYCKDCHYWQSHTGQNNVPWHTCQLPNWANYNEDIGRDNMAIYVDANDDSGLEYDLKTGPMFGCLKFKLRSQTDSEDN